MSLKKTACFLLGAAGAYLLLAPGGPAEKSIYRIFLFRDWLGRNFKVDTAALDGDGIELIYGTFAARDGSSINCAQFKKKGSVADSLILYCHGNAANIERRADIIRLLLAALPNSVVFIFDYRGYGQSEGTPSVQHIIEDGLSAYDYVQAEGWCADDIVIYGESLGCAVACRVMKLRKAAAVILQSGFTSLKQVARERIFLLRAYWHDRFWPDPNLDNAEAVAGDHPPILIVHGAQDRTIGVHHAQSLYDCASEPRQLVILPHSTHMKFNEDEGAFQAAVTGFVTACLAGRGRQLQKAS